jgi:hypothetical protein
VFFLFVLLQLHLDDKLLQLCRRHFILSSSCSGSRRHPSDVSLALTQLLLDAPLLHQLLQLQVFFPFQLLLLLLRQLTGNSQIEFSATQSRLESVLLLFLLLLLLTRCQLLL